MSDLFFSEMFVHESKSHTLYFTNAHILFETLPSRRRQKIFITRSGEGKLHVFFQGPVDEIDIFQDVLPQLSFLDKLRFINGYFGDPCARFCGHPLTQYLFLSFPKVAFSVVLWLFCLKLLGPPIDVVGESLKTGPLYTKFMEWLYQSFNQPSPQLQEQNQVIRIERQQKKAWLVGCLSQVGLSLGIWGLQIFITSLFNGRGKLGPIPPGDVFIATENITVIQPAAQRPQTVIIEEFPA